MKVSPRTKLKASLGVPDGPLLDRSVQQCSVKLCVGLLYGRDTEA